MEPQKTSGFLLTSGPLLYETSGFLLTTLPTIVNRNFVLEPLKTSRGNSSINMSMNYQLHYDALVAKAIVREEYDDYDARQFYEHHHIIPRSHGGSDDPLNIVLLTPKEHYLAHLLLWQIGDGNQIFAVECFLNDSIDINRPHRVGLFRWKKWLRRAVAYQRAANLRQAAKVELDNKWINRLRSLNKQYESTISSIEAKYAGALLDAAGAEMYD